MFAVYHDSYTCQLHWSHCGNSHVGFISSTVRTAAGRNDRWQRQSLHFAQCLMRGIDHKKNVRFTYPIINIPTFSLILHKSSFPQNHKLLRKICLPIPKRRLDVANAGFAVTKNLENCQPGRMHENLEQLNLGVVIQLLFWHHIHPSEYYSRHLRVLCQHATYHIALVTEFILAECI